MNTDYVITLLINTLSTADDKYCGAMHTSSKVVFYKTNTVCTYNYYFI